jgi:hypothetical protein
MPPIFCAVFGAGIMLLESVRPLLPTPVQALNLLRKTGLNSVQSAIAFDYVISRPDGDSDVQIQINSCSRLRMHVFSFRDSRSAAIGGRS